MPTLMWLRIGGVLRSLKADRHMALGTQIVDLVGLDLAEDAGEVGGIREIAVVQLQAGIWLVRILVDVINALGVEMRRPTLDAMDFIALLEEELRQVRAILARDAGDECFFHDLILNLSYRRPSTDSRPKAYLTS